MLRLFRVLLIASLLVSLAPVLPAAAQAGTLPPNCQEVRPDLASPEIYLICLPWPPTTPPLQFDLVVFAHGYVRPGAPMNQYYEQLKLADGNFLPLVANGLGYAYASTSYSKNGLAVKEGLADTVRLIQTFKGQYPGVRFVYLIGASEGGLITTLAAEQPLTPISGGLAMCGPIGSFRGQIDYWGNFRVLFDYFYPHQLPGIPIQIPARLMSAWESVYKPLVAGLIGTGNPHTTQQLLDTSLAPIDPANPSTAIATTVGILDYNVFATNEAKVELGGQPFDNKDKVYEGSDNDQALNKPGGVRRFAADEAALNEIAKYYETSGQLQVPLVTLHTKWDPIVPYWHETLYGAKVPQGRPYVAMTSVIPYGHCTFTPDEAIGAFLTLVGMVTSGQ